MALKVWEFRILLGKPFAYGRVYAKACPRIRGYYYMKRVLFYTRLP